MVDDDLESGHSGQVVVVDVLVVEQGVRILDHCRLCPTWAAGDEGVEVANGRGGPDSEREDLVDDLRHLKGIARVAGVRIVAPWTDDADLLQRRLVGGARSSGPTLGLRGGDVPGLADVDRTHPLHPQVDAARHSLRAADQALLGALQADLGCGEADLEGQIIELAAGRLGPGRHQVGLQVARHPRPRLHLVALVSGAAAARGGGLGAHLLGRRGEVGEVALGSVVHRCPYRGGGGDRASILSATDLSAFDPAKEGPPVPVAGPGQALRLVDTVDEASRGGPDPPHGDRPCPVGGGLAPEANDGTGRLLHVAGGGVGVDPRRVGLERQGVLVHQERGGGFCSHSIPREAHEQAPGDRVDHWMGAVPTINGLAPPVHQGVLRALGHGEPTGLCDQHADILLGHVGSPGHGIDGETSHVGLRQGHRAGPRPVSGIEHVQLLGSGARLGDEQPFSARIACGSNVFQCCRQGKALVGETGRVRLSRSEGRFEVDAHRARRQGVHITPHRQGGRGHLAEHVQEPAGAAAQEPSPGRRHTRTTLDSVGPDQRVAADVVIARGQLRCVEGVEGDPRHPGILSGILSQHVEPVLGREVGEGDDVCGHGPAGVDGGDLTGEGETESDVLGERQGDDADRLELACEHPVVNVVDGENIQVRPHGAGHLERVGINRVEAV